MSVVKTEKLSFEDALDKTGFGLYSYCYTALTGLIIIAFVCVAYGSTIIVPASACELGTTSAQQGAMVAAPVVGNVLGTLIWGYLADTRGRRRMLLVSLCCGAVVNGLASLSVSWAMLLAMQLLATFLASGQYALSMTLVSESVPRARRNLVVLLVSSIFLLSQGVMSVLAMPILPLTFSTYLPALGIYWNSWRTLLLVYSLPSVLAALALLGLRESPKFLAARGERGAALDVLRTIRRWNLGEPGFETEELLEESSGSESSSVKQQIVPLFRAPLLRATLVMTSLFVLFQTAAAFMAWLPMISNQFMHSLRAGDDAGMTLCGVIDAGRDVPPDPNAVPCALDVTALLIVLGVCGLQSGTNFLLTLAVGFGGRRNTAIAATAAFGVSGLLVNAVPQAIGSAVLFAGFLLGIVVIGLYTAMCVALFPTHLRAMAVALVMAGGRVASLATIQLVNLLLLDRCELAFYLFAALYASSAVFLLLLPDDRAPPPPKTDELPGASS